jgi:hypothetical protein
MSDSVGDDTDEPALSWDGEGDSTHVASPKGAKPAAPKPEDAAPAASAPTPATSSFLLITYGILGGAYLLYTVGWVIGIGRVNDTASDALSVIMGVVTSLLAIASGAIWFGGAFLLTRGRKPVIRLLLLLLGLVVLIPWPFVLLSGAN